MIRNELPYSDEEIIQLIYKGYGIKSTKIAFIEVGSFYGFNVETLFNTKLFLKIYPQSQSLVPIQPTLKQLDEVGAALQRFREEFDIKNLSYCVPDISGKFCFVAKDLILILFEHIQGFHPSYSPNQLFADKLAQIFVQLHQIPPEKFSKLEKENFEIDYAVGLSEWLNHRLTAGGGNLEVQMLTCLNLYQEKLLAKIQDLKKWRMKFINRSINFVITHGDAHHFNVLQTDAAVWLVDWDGLKIAPAERDLWHYDNAPLMAEYRKLKSSYQIDRELCKFYQLQRFLEDSHYYLDQVLFRRNSTLAQDKQDKDSFLNHWGWKLCLE